MVSGSASEHREDAAPDRFQGADYILQLGCREGKELISKPLGVDGALDKAKGLEPPPELHYYSPVHCRSRVWLNCQPSSSKSARDQSASSGVPFHT